MACADLNSSTLTFYISLMNPEVQAQTEALTQRWLELDDTIRRSNELVKDIRSERNKVGDDLVELLQSQGYNKPSLRLGGETIALTESRRRAPLTLELVGTAMLQAGVEAHKMQEVIGWLERQREENASTSVALSRRKSRRARRTRRAPRPCGTESNGKPASQAV
jgi:hypothetical protein